MKALFSAGALLLSSALAHATPVHWTFSYSGFYDAEAQAFLPDMRIDGAFSGEDANGDGLLERGELGSLLLGQMDYVACAARSNAYYYCGADSFTFSTGGGLAFSVAEYASDPEGWSGGGHLATSGEMIYDYSFNPAASSEHHLVWTDATVLTMSSALATTSASQAAASVPEAPTWALLLAGLGGMALWRRRKHH